MAHITTNHAPAAGQSLLRSIGDSILNGLVRIAEANSRVREAERLNSMSDEELSRRGLKREDIVRYVFRDAFYV